VAEGAIDSNNESIKAEYVKEVISSQLELDCRVTTLGHVQRGGNTSAFDRYLSTLQGVEAVEAILEPHDRSLAILIGTKQNKISRNPLMESVMKTRSVSVAIKSGDFKTAFNLRDAYFKANYQLVESLKVRHDRIDYDKTFNIGLINVGAPCGGMNSANRAVVHYCLNQGHRILGIYNGFHGLEAGEVKELSWADVDSWVSMGGSELGTNRHLPENDLGNIACQFQKYGISALVIIGGFEAFVSIMQLSKNRHIYPAFAIPMICLPATVSNNVPGTDFSIGSDTAVNSIMEMCDCIKQSASSSRKRLFVVDVQGGHCGYLATVSGLITGATYSYIHEDGVRLEDLMRESKHLRNRFSEDKRQGRIILRNEFCSDTYSAEVMSKIFEEEAEGSFDSRWVSLGHIVQGGRPSPLDRIRGARMAVMAVNYIEAFLCPERLAKSVYEEYIGIKNVEIEGYLDNLEHAESNEDPASSELLQLLGSNSKIAAAVIGIHGPDIKCTSAVDLAEKATIMKYRIPKNQWWYSLRKINRIMAKYSD
jgi:6-phosphofructokinase 1